VKLDQSKKFYKALRGTNKQAKYIEIKNGTHYLDEEKNRKRVFKAMDQFLNQHL
jgi:dipeptidyl aminopeptidase/acylaminoacyl peptidase